MTNTAKVLDILENHLPAIEDEFEWINWGGCGIMASLIAEQLDKLRVKYDIVCKAGYACNYAHMSNQQVNDVITDNNDRDVPNSHVLVKVDGRIFDSEGEQSIREKSITALIDHPTLKRMNKGDFWNSDFDRSQVDGMRVFTELMFDKAFG